MRYVVATEGVLPVDPMSGKELKDIVLWKDLIKGIFLDNRLIQSIDVFTLIELRASLINLGKGQCAKIDDNEWAILCAVIKRPQTLLASIIYGKGAEEFFRAFTDAPTRDPQKANLKEAGAA